jgi:hypothetical protein
MDICENCPTIISNTSKALQQLEAGERRFERMEKKFDHLKTRTERGITGLIFSVFVIIGGILLAPKKISSIATIIIKLFK